jgi:hypothetical protein
VEVFFFKNQNRNIKITGYIIFKFEFISNLRYQSGSNEEIPDVFVTRPTVVLYPWKHLVLQLLCPAAEQVPATQVKQAVAPAIKPHLSTSGKPKTVIAATQTTGTSPASLPGLPRVCARA